jgi:hypothetical protein
MAGDYTKTASSQSFLKSRTTRSGGGIPIIFHGSFGQRPLLDYQ